MEAPSDNSPPAASDHPAATGPPAALPAELELELTDLSHGPAAIGRAAGKVVFVRDGVPGDRVRVRLLRQKRSFAEATIIELRSPGAARRAPPCPHAADCGGCPWQHVDYAAQLAAKQASVRRELARLPGLDAPAVDALLAAIIPAPAEWGYRHRVRLHVDRRGRAGYQRPQSHAVVVPEVCPVAHPQIVDHFAVVQDLIAALATPIGLVEVHAHPERDGVVLALAARGTLARGDRGIVGQLLEQVPSVLGVFVHGPGWGWQRGALELPLQPAPAAPVIPVPVTAFSQANPAANRLLVEAVAGAAGLTGGEQVLELHAGAGNLTAVLAPGAAALQAVERHRRAAQTLANLARSQRWDHVHVTRAEVGQALEGLLAAGRSFDLVVADPPRAGMAREARQLLELGPPRLVYVSCDLATLVRDLRALIGGGYRLTGVRTLDLFPQTFHVELVAALERGR